MVVGRLGNAQGRPGCPKARTPIAPPGVQVSEERASVHSEVGSFGWKLGKEFLVSVELAPPKGVNPAKLLVGAEMLKAKGVDTTTLESQITELKAKITTYSTDLAAYKQSLTDLKAVDCKTDPDAFQAGAGQPLRSEKCGQHLVELLGLLLLAGEGGEVVGVGHQPVDRFDADD